MKSGQKFPYFAICVDNHGVSASLQLGKGYRVIQPLRDDRAGELRVIDEEEEGYLYPRTRFVEIELPAP